MRQGLPVVLLLLLLLACSAAAVPPERQQQQGPGRRLLAVRDGRGGTGTSMLHAGVQDAAAARLCALQCLQHGCISWTKVYMGMDDTEGSEGSSQQQRPDAVPAAAGECLAQCGMPAQEAGCLAQTFNRLLNASPLQFSCGSSCLAGLLHSSCRQCSGSDSSNAESGCAALQLEAAVPAAECLVDAAV